MSGSFVVGEGEYDVLWQMYDSLGAYCELRWSINAKRKRGERDLKLSIEPGEVGESRVYIFRSATHRSRAPCRERPLDSEGLPQPRPLAGTAPRTHPRRRATIRVRASASCAAGAGARSAVLAVSRWSPTAWKNKPSIHRQTPATTRIDFLRDRRRRSKTSLRPSSRSTNSEKRSLGNSSPRLLASDFPGDVAGRRLSFSWGRTRRSAAACGGKISRLSSALRRRYSCCRRCASPGAA